MIDFAQGKFIIRARAGLVYGVGAFGEVGFMVNAKTIVHLAQFVYHLLMQADYRHLDALKPDAFKALSSYIVQSIMNASELVEKEWEKLQTWWDDSEEAMDKAEALAKSINNKSQDKLLRVSTPEAKGKMLAILSITSWFSFEEEQEEAIVYLLTFIQSKNEAKNVFKSITLDDTRLENEEEGKAKLHHILDGKEQYLFNRWLGNLPIKPTRLSQKVEAISSVKI